MTAVFDWSKAVYCKAPAIHYTPWQAILRGSPERRERASRKLFKLARQFAFDADMTLKFQVVAAWVRGTPEAREEARAICNDYTPFIGNVIEAWVHGGPVGLLVCPVPASAMMIFTAL